MTERQTTVMVLVPGRNAFSIVVPRSPRASATLAVLLPLLTGVVSQRVLTADSQSLRSAAHVAMGSVGNVSPVMSVSNVLRERLEHRRGNAHGRAASSTTTSVQGAMAPRGIAPSETVHLPHVTQAPVPRAIPGPAEPALVLAITSVLATPTAAPSTLSDELSVASAAAPAPTHDDATLLEAARDTVPVPEAAHDLVPVPEAAQDVPTTAAADEAQKAVAVPDEPQKTVAVIDVKTVLRTLSSLRRGTATPDDVSHIPSSGLLRLQALHLGEYISVHPFNEDHEANPADMAQLSHAMRCRVTGTEIAIDPKLAEILVRLHALYGREIQLISGHRQPNTISTKPTSQHASGRAADIRIPGVSIEELKRVALSLGARGVGLYPEKGFVHVDVRPQTRYTWVYTAARGEQSDVRLASEAARKTAETEVGTAAPSATAEGDSEAEPEAHEAETDLEQ